MTDLIKISAMFMQSVLLVATGFPLMYLLFFAVAGWFYRQPRIAVDSSPRKIAVLIPAYREDGVIVHTAMDALRQDYPRELYDVVVIADSLMPETIDSLRQMPVKVIEVRFDKSTKTKALNSAMERLGDDYDIAVVLDADNLMATDFLTRINAGLQPGITALQGHRTAKNLDTPMAILDAVSEEVNNHIFRRGHRAAGLSSAIIGSGMAFPYGFFKEMMLEVRAVGGFDKEIELRMLKEGHAIGYLDDAIVLDEKIRREEAFTNQRRRWLSAQATYLRKDFGPALSALLTRGNLDYFDKVVQFMLPPRILLLGAISCAAILFVSLNILLGIPESYSYYWLAYLALIMLVFLLSVPRRFYNIPTLKALGSVPRGMFLMTKSLFRIRGANKEFIHTEHHSPVVHSTGVASRKTTTP